MPIKGVLSNKEFQKVPAKICLKCGASFATSKKTPGDPKKRKVYSSRKYCLQCSPPGRHNTRRLHLPPAPSSGCYENVKLFRHRRKLQAVSYLGGKCRKCGYKKCLRALTFHHRNPKHKEFGIGQLTNRSWELVKKELDKCDLLCMNCHMEIHEAIDGGRLTSKRKFKK